jgi:hypothetical protein
MAVDFLSEVIMVEHKAHVVSVAGDADDAFAECGDEVVQVSIQHVGAGKGVRNRFDP